VIVLGPNIRKKLSLKPNKCPYSRCLGQVEMLIPIEKGWVHDKDVYRCNACYAEFLSSNGLDAVCNIKPNKIEEALWLKRIVNHTEIPGFEKIRKKNRK